MQQSLDELISSTSLLFPCSLLPCENNEQEDEPAAVPVPVTLSAPDNAALLTLLPPLQAQLCTEETVRHADGYDLAGVSLPVRLFLDALQRSGKLPGLYREARDWLTRGATAVLLRLPQRCQHLGAQTQVWGHEASTLAGSHRQQALGRACNRCHYCGHAAADNQVLVRDGDSSNTTPANLTVACDLCALSQRLNTLSARDGVMVWLPELSPAALSHLLRSTLHHRHHGTAQQQADARKVMAWLVSHRAECEAFWGTSHPGEFGEALLRADPETREDLLLRLRGVALIPNPALFRHL